MNRLRRVLDTSGMSLVEALAAVLIIALAAAMLAGAFFAALGIFRRGVERTSAGDMAWAEVQAAPEAFETGRVLIEAGDDSFFVEGAYFSGRGSEGQVSVEFHAYRPR